MIKFSIIIPTYNNVQELISCCKSLINQTFQDFEVIVVNDGSDEDYSDFKSIKKEIKNLKYVEIKNSGGPAKPRNIGISKSIGEYICFLDSDDMWCPKYLELILRHCESYDFLCTGAYIKRGSEITKIIPRLKQKFPESILLKGNPIFTSSVTVRREVLIENRLSFNESKDLSSVEDLELWFRLLSTQRIRFKLLRKPLIYYKVSSESISHKDCKGYIDKHKKLFKIFEGSIKIGKHEYQNYLRYISAVILLKNNKIIQGINQVFEVKLISRNGIFLILKYLLRMSINSLK